MIVYHKLYFEEHVKMTEKPAIDMLFDEVSQVFWIILICYIFASCLWIIYCCYIHKVIILLIETYSKMCCLFSRELNIVEKKIEENAMARSRELQRLLNAYNKITKSEEDPSDRHPPSQSIIIPEQV
ncbi:hypothetical protein B9Z55_005674 [Caenorhabditis nigoni]|uniref:Uncharacterized protein n=1 Tax=Caenorhabditis nigoni TaxID=1611254 RepID=A0A2G5V299_9PELO|nr:hypothetical protein B9Z55_005674 [Caenorhabditis nigoni]